MSPNYPNQRSANSANFFASSNYPVSSSSQEVYSSSVSPPTRIRQVSSTFEDSRQVNVSDNWTTKPMPLPNLRDLFQDNFQGSTLPNNHVLHLSNNLSNNVSCSLPSASMPSQHMWHEEGHVQYPPTTERNLFNRTSSCTSSSYGYASIGNQTKDFNSSTSSPTNILSTNSPYNHHIQHEVHAADSQQHLINQLRERIHLLERELETQHKTITELQRENYELKTAPNKRENSELQNQNEPRKKKAQKKRKTSPVSNEQLSNNLLTTQTTFSLVDESGASKQPVDIEEAPVLGGIEQFSVKWKGENYVLVDVFKNRTQIMNYFVPLYQSQFPDKNCKVVLSSEEYKQLFRENTHRSQSERKHAWRISIFTIDFYNFVKNQQV
ncbi:predicted protein [Naegleria gruberi]|uniref:Predicted protein n=1 Tax=Naegleria gruberi TaxID=5762 RepID=D2VXH9_NAEGR|nr:uncharacterized protein NAEGRDRAFT_81602 [Naegleria gruberi]EFC38510.1 predicted protein [Naegleria gruberi]|eukprot:XP_002671254.1 predicted protein [Naegleria gruberi strain NEG-M]